MTQPTENSSNTPSSGDAQLFGHSRTHVSARHALIAPDGHVPSALPGYSGAVPYYMISLGMGAGVSQIMVKFDPNGRALLPGGGREQAFYVESGSVRVELAAKARSVPTLGFGYIPADKQATIKAESDGAQITIFEKTYQPLDGVTPPGATFGVASEVEPEPFLGYEGAMLRTLFPTSIEWDLAMNVFTYRPGATLPFVETHIMEHGLLMLEGQGIYRLEDDYYPVMEGDAIWMAPYCPQWFVAMGDGPASYLYYKNVNRHE